MSIVVKNLTHIYNEGMPFSSKALDNISFEIKDRDFVGLIGHTGSGKSTLIQHLNGILKPSSGDIYINDFKITDPDLNLTEIRKRVEESLKSVGMYELRDRQPHLLSGGQKQRVAIAGIIAMRPKCIIFDEATAMLDPSGRKEVMKTIKKLNKEENITTLHITHFMEEAVQADRVIVMEKGRKVLEGTPREVFSNIKKLREIGLDVPYMTELANLLSEEGLKISNDILTVDEMVMELCQL